MQANVRILCRDGAGALSAELVDVSAGGVRVRADSPRVHGTGAAVDVEIRLGDEAGLPSSAPVCLRAPGVVVRVEEVIGGALETALCFTGALEMHEPFDRLLLF